MIDNSQLYAVEGANHADSVLQGFSGIQGELHQVGLSGELIVIVAQRRDARQNELSQGNASMPISSLAWSERGIVCAVVLDDAEMLAEQLTQGAPRA